jgi:hypothetical protein
VLGGTGKYAGANGVMLFKGRPHGRYETEFRLES